MASEPTPAQRALLDQLYDLLRRAVYAAVEANDAAWEDRCAPLVAALERIANDPRGSAYVLVARDALRAYRADEGGERGE